MKQLLTLIFISISIACFGQPPKEQSKPEELKRNIPLSLGERLTIQEHNEYVKDFAKKYHEFQRRDSSQLNFKRILLQANGIDLTRVSLHPDSVKITDKEILLILKPEKK